MHNKDGPQRGGQGNLLDCTPLAMLFADHKLGAASKLAFLMLWRFAGGQPGSIVITADWLASQCGRSPKAAWLWIEELKQHDLIDTGERNERRGTIVIHVFHPCPGNRAAITDPQTRMDFSPAPEPPSGDRVAEVLEPKPPRSLVQRDGISISCQSTNVTKEPKTNQGSTSNALPKRATAEKADFAAIVAALPDQAQQKERLKRRIVDACHPHELADWVAGAAADIVVYHGVHPREMNAILADIEAMRRAGGLRDAARFFHVKARELAARHGVHWPRRQAEVLQ